jgi:hypothetical protein
MYDGSKLSLISATVVVPPWRPRPASATAIPNADLQLPDGWSDDGEKLTAPNGVSIVLGFRHWILSHRWNPADMPLAPEAGANPVELSDPTSGSGTRLITLYSEFAWTKSKGVWNAAVGRELWTTLAELEELSVTPAPTGTTSAGGGPAGEETEAQHIKRDLMATARMIGDTAAHLLAQATKL